MREFRVGSVGYKCDDSGRWFRHSGETYPGKSWEPIESGEVPSPSPEESEENDL